MSDDTNNAPELASKPSTPAWHHAATVSVLVVFACWVWLRDGTKQIGADQTNIVTMVLAQRQPDLFERDPFFSGESWRWYPWLARATTAWALDHYGIFGGHRVLQFPLVVGYLVVMYTALWWLTGSVPAAAVVAMLSSLRRNSLGGSYWGLDLLLTVQPRSAVLICVPLLVVLAWRWRRDWRLAIPFGLAGLLMNVNPPGALFFTGLLGLAFLITLRRSEVRFPHLAAGAGAFVVGALPFVIGHLAARSGGGDAGLDVPRELLLQAAAFRHTRSSTFPIAPAAYHHALIHVGVPLVLGVAGWVMRARQRGPLDRFLWTFFLLAAIGVPVGQYVMQLACEGLGRLAPVANLMRGQKYAYLVLHIYTAYLVAGLLARCVGRWDRVALITVVGAAAAFGEPPFNRFLLQYNAQQASALMRGDKIVGAPAALAKLTQWAKRETPRGSLFLLTHPKMHWFRMHAQRPMVVAFPDAGMAFYNGPEHLIRWYRYYGAVESLYRRPNPELLSNLVAATKADYVAVLRGWPKLRPWPEVYRDANWTVYRVDRR